MPFAPKSERQRTSPHFLVKRPNPVPVTGSGDSPLNSSRRPTPSAATVYYFKIGSNTLLNGHGGTDEFVVSNASAWYNSYGESNGGTATIQADAAIGAAWRW